VPLAAITTPITHHWTPTAAHLLQTIQGTLPGFSQCWVIYLAGQHHVYHFAGPEAHEHQHEPATQGKLAGITVQDIQNII